MDASRSAGWGRERLVWVAILCGSLASLPLYSWSKTLNVNSDDLSFYCFAQDLFGSGYRLTEWYWCQSLYLLPDQLLFVPLARFFTNPLHAFYVYSILLFLLQISACTALYSRLAGGNRDLLAFVSLQSLTLILLVHGQVNFPQRALSWVGWHGGILVPGLVFVVLAMRASRPSRPHPALHVALFGISYVSTLSDRLFLVQFCIPTVICWSWLWWRKRIGLSLVTILTLLCLGAVGLAIATQAALSRWGWVHMPILPAVTWEARLQCLLQLGRILLQMCTAAPFSVIILILGIGLCARHLQSSHTDELEWDWIALFYPICLVGSFLAPVYMGLIRTYDHSRFFYPIAIPGSLIVIAVWLRQPRPRLSLLPCCVLLFITIVTLARWPTDWKLFREKRLDLSTWGQAESLSRALAEHGIKCGYAGFWEAKVLSLAHPSHRASQLRPGGGVFPWLTNLDYYFTDNHPELGRGIPCYEYLFMSHRQLISLRDPPFWQRFGAPAEQVICGLDAVLIYNRPSDVGFRNFLRLPCLIAASRPLPVSSTRDELRAYKPSGTPSLAPGAIASKLNQTHQFPLERPVPVAGHVLELSLDYGCAYEVTYLYQGVAVGSTVIVAQAPRLPPGLNPFFLLIEDSVQSDTVDAIQVRPVVCEGTTSIGHLFVYPDSRISPRERQSTPGAGGKSIASK